MIHTSNVAVIEKVEAEVVSAPKPMTVPTVRNHTYTRRTLFEGNRRRISWDNRQNIWDGLGNDVSTASSAMEVCRLAGLDYEVKTENIYTSDGLVIPNMVATRRYDNDVPSTVYGVVTNRYEPVQNHKGFEFMDVMFNHDGFEVETAGQFDDGKIVWIEARLPQRTIGGENIDPYLVFTNRHDGKGSVKIFLTPVRVICKNTLNMAIRKAQNRTFSVKHTSTANARLEVAKETLEHYNAYLSAMNDQIERQKTIFLEDKQLENMINLMFQFKEEDSQRTKEKVMLQRTQLLDTYRNAPDLDGYGNTAFRFVNAVSDWATHHIPSRQTKNWRSNLMQNTLEGNKYIDMAVNMVDEMEPRKMIAI